MRAWNPRVRWFVFFGIFCFGEGPLSEFFPQAGNLLVEGLGVGGSAGDIGVTGGLVGAGGELELCRRITVSRVQSSTLVSSCERLLAQPSAFLRHAQHNKGEGCRDKTGEGLSCIHTVGGLQVGIAGGAVGGGVVTEVEEESEHLPIRRRHSQLSPFGMFVKHPLAGSAPAAYTPNCACAGFPACPCAALFLYSPTIPPRPPLTPRHRTFGNEVE